MPDRILAMVLCEALALVLVLFLAWCQWRGFDPSFCESYRACDWRRA